MIEHQTKIRVRYSETDQMGFVYYGNYAAYCEVGRVETLRSVGLSYKELEEQGVILPVTHFEIHYYHPAQYDDELTVHTQIKDMPGVKITFQYQICKEEQLLCKAITTLVFVSKATGKPVKPPAKFVQLMNRFFNK